MATIGTWDEREFQADFPINFGKGHRGHLVYKGTQPIGIVEAHRLESGEICAGTIYWVPQADKPVWALESLEPLTVTPSVRCDCGTHGYIRNGQWQDA